MIVNWCVGPSQLPGISGLNNNSNNDGDDDDDNTIESFFITFLLGPVNCQGYQG